MGQVLVSAYKTTGGTFKGWITFDTVLENIGNALNGGSGVFTCPRSGTYFFTLTGESYSSTTAFYVQIYVNGVVRMTLYDYQSHNHNTFSMNIAEKLESGDQLQLKIENGHLHVPSNTRRVYFNGFLLNATD